MDGICAVNPKATGARIHPKQPACSRMPDLPSPLASPFLDSGFGGEVEIDFGGLQSVVAEKRLQRASADAFLDALNGEGVAKHVRSHRFCDACFGRNPLDDSLYRSGRQIGAFLKQQRRLDDSADAVAHGNNATLGSTAVGTAFSEDNDAALLPLNVLARETGEFRHAQTGVEKRPDDELLAQRPASIDEQVNLARVEGFAFVLIHEYLFVAVLYKGDTLTFFLTRPSLD